ncbi:MAG: ATP-dependent Clp protease proteolytic subunit [Candidatus Azambacteria bacterium]|nr:ATP-dependent Clp protease proteolytic subunit [Candidatus Azambacteria bacterium]
MISDREFKLQRSRFVRQVLFEKKRILYLEGNFDQSQGLGYSGNDPTLPFFWATSPRAVIDQIFYLESQNHEPIKLIIDHPGGVIKAFFNLHDVIMVAQSPIYTIAMGLVSSAAVSVLAAGKKRFIFPNSQTMIHMAKTSNQGDEDEIEKQRKEFLKIQQQYIGVLSKRTGKSSGVIKEAMKVETWMNAEESKAFGLVDHIIVSLVDID